MTEHQTMNTIIHAAFRRDLARFDAALGEFPDGSQERAAQLVTAWDNFAHQLHHHHQDEETIFWPAFRELGADEALTSDLGGEDATRWSGRRPSPPPLGLRWASSVRWSTSTSTTRSETWSRGPRRARTRRS